MTDSGMKSRHNLIERFRGGKAEVLNLDFFIVSKILPGLPLWQKDMGSIL